MGRNNNGGRGNGSRTSGGRGRGRSSNNNRGRGDNKKSTPKSKEYKFNPLIMGESSKYHPYVTVHKHLMAVLSNKLGKWSQDIVQSFDDDKLVDLQSIKPVRNMGTKPTLKTKKRDGTIKVADELAEAEAVFRAEMAIYQVEQQGRDIEHSVDHEEWKGRVQQFENNKARTVRTIEESYCTRAMASRINTQSDYDVLKKDPVQLLRRIRTLQHEPNRNTYAFATLHAKIRAMVNIKQQKDDDLLDYTLTFKSYRDILKGLLGDRWLDHFVEQTADYKALTDPAEQTAVKAGAFDRLMGYILMQQSDHDRYGSLIRQMNMNQNLNSDTFPEGVAVAIERLSSHEVDNKGKNKKTDKSDKKKEDNKQNNDNKPPENTVGNHSFGQLKNGCYICGSSDHLSPGCPDKEKMKNRQQEWYINKASSHYQEFLSSQASAGTASTEDAASVQSAPARTQLKEVKQLHDRTCFWPVDVSTLTPDEKRKAMNALIFLCQKRDGTVKAREVYNGKPTREWLSREDSASPTASLESLILTGVIDVMEHRDIMCIDVPNAFIQAKIPEEWRAKERIIMKITGVLVDFLVQAAPNIYQEFVVYERGKRVLYVEVLRAIYGMLIASILWFNKFTEELKQYGFVFNEYDPCVANKTVDGKQHTIRFHVDDVMSSHVDANVNDKFYKWLNDKYGKLGAVTAHRGKVHDYLGVIYRYHDNILELDNTDYIMTMIRDFQEATNIKLDPANDSNVVGTPAANNVFDEGKSSKLNKDKQQIYHRFVAKGLFVSKRGRPDIQLTIAVLCTRVKEPNGDDWRKLVRLMFYLNGTRLLTLRIDVTGGINILKWFIDASFAVHPDFKSHTGAILYFGPDRGKGGALSVSRKQKLNTKSSTEAEVVGVDDVSTMILWTKLFLEEQGYFVDKNIIFQDNQSAILLEVNGKKSSSKRTRALNIRYFFITDQVDKGNTSVMWCPTGQMHGDFHTKATQGQLFNDFCIDLMNPARE